MKLLDILVSPLKSPDYTVFTYAKLSVIKGWIKIATRKYSIYLAILQLLLRTSLLPAIHSVF